MNKRLVRNEKVRSQNRERYRLLESKQKTLFITTQRMDGKKSCDLA